MGMVNSTLDFEVGVMTFDLLLMTIPAGPALTTLISSQKGGYDGPKSGMTER